MGPVDDDTNQVITAATRITLSVLKNTFIKIESLVHHGRIASQGPYDRIATKTEPHRATLLKFLTHWARLFLTGRFVKLCRSRPRGSLHKQEVELRQ